MMKNFTLTLFFLFFVSIVLVSCNSNDSIEIKKSPVASEVFEPNIAPTNTQETQLVRTDDKFVEIFESNQQISDGKLLFTIKNLTKNCIELEEKIDIEFSFQNSTNIPILFQSRLAINPNWFSSDGDLIFQVYKSDKTLLIHPGATAVDTNFFEDPLIFEEISASSSFRKVISFKFPYFFIEDESPVTPSPGYYYIRFIYHNTLPTLENEWTGTVSSNQIRICIK